MLRRVWYVLLTYATRPMVRVLAAMYVFVFSIAMFDLNEQWRFFISGTTYTEVAYSGRTQRLFALDGVLKDQNQRPLSSSVVTVTIDGPGLSASHLRQLQACSRLRMLKLNQLAPFDFQKKLEIGDEEAAALGDLKQLEALSLSGCNLPPNIWKHLGELPNLRYLDLSGCGLWGDYSGLESLSQLETLILGRPSNGFKENQAPLLPELKQIPNLKTLVVWDYYPLRTVQKVAKETVPGTPASTPQPSDPVIDAFEDLKAIPTLQTLYVNEFGINYSGEFRAGRPRFEVLRRQLTPIRMRPACVDSYRTSPVVGVILQSMILMALLVLQFDSYFHQVGAQLIPNYKTPHVVPLVVIWITGVFANIVPFLTHGVPLLAAMGLGLLPWAILCGFGLVGPAVHAVTSTMSKSVRALILLAVLGWTAGLFLMLPWNRSTIDWYFRGHEPGWAWFFIASGTASSAGLLWLSVNRTPKDLAKLVLARPPLGSSLADNMAWAQLYWQQKEFEDQWKRMTTSMNRKLERAIEGAANSGWRARSNLWIVGNLGIFGPSGDSNSLTKGMLYFIAMVLIVSAVVNLGDTSDLSPLAMLRNPMLAINLLMSGLSSYVLFAGTLWRCRRKLFACESLRPMSRRQFDREIAIAIAWDLFPLGGVYLVALTWYTIQADPEMWTVLWTLIMLIFFVAQWIVVYGFTLWSIVIRRNWVALATGGSALGVLTSVNSSILSRQSQMFGDVTTIPLMQLGPLTCWNLLFALVGCVIARLAYWRWQSIELA